MATEYNKLVRDRIPELLNQAGFTYDIATMNEQEYQHALYEKLIEEALEAATASSPQLITELADLYEVMDTLMTINGINSDAVRAEQERRRNERGGFTQRIRLLRTTAPESEGTGPRFTS
jgi:predicted house-cleaning noncanonical NTP pyrophosphatase (MazG superfamily)